MYILSMIILVFFAIIGLCAFITAIVDHMHNTDHGEITLLLQELDTDNAEACIRRAARIAQDNSGVQVVCVCNKDDPAYAICEMMQKDYPFIRIESSA